MDRVAFQQVGHLLTHYAINLVNIEYRATKDLYDQIENGAIDEFKLDKSARCQFGYELPARYRLPCKH